MDSDSQQKGRGQNKHYWTSEEDKVLIEALVELSTNCMWWAENGFRNGYLQQLERRIQEKFPETILKVVPNIESRVKLFRTKTSAIADILRISGFDWNHESCTIMCEKSAYDEYVKNHKEAAGLYGNCFPFSNDLAPVFAKDRAQGNASADIGDDAKQYAHENISTQEGVGLSQREDFFMPMQEPIQFPSPMASDTNTSQTSTRRKRKAPANDLAIDSMAENFRQLIELVGPGLNSISQFATHKEEAIKESKERRKSLRHIIFAIEGLFGDEAMFLLQVLANDEEEMDVFLDLPDDMKLSLCRTFLAIMSYHPPSL